MTVEVTRLPSGLSVVTDRMPHLEIAPRSASGSAPAAATSGPTSTAFRICSNTWRSRAPSGAPRARSPRRSRRSAAISTPATSTESTAFYARVLKADVPLAIDVLSDILSEPAFDPEELRREQNVIVQEIGAVEDAPDDLVFDRLQETAFPKQAVGRSILGTPETVRSFNSDSHPRLSRAQLSRARHAGGRRRRYRAQGDCRRGREAIRELRRPGGAGAGAGAIPRRHARGKPRSRTGAYRAGAARPVGARRGALQPAGIHQRARRRHVVAPVPGGAREARALLFDPRLPHALCRHRLVRALCRHRRDRRARVDARGHRPDRQRHRDHQRQPRSPAPRRR